MNEVKSFWDDRAADPSLDPSQVTHPDVWQRWLEIETIKRVLPRRKRVVDIGCGAGFSTKQLAHLSESIVGIDYSAGMIKRAKTEGEPVPANAEFRVGDVLTLSPSDVGSFDVALTVRCLINLADWETQKRALTNIASILKRGGLYIFVEGLKDGRDALNELRVASGLDAMPKVWHNVDFEGKATLDFLSAFFDVEQQIGFGTYDLIARVVHPLYVAPDQPKYDSKINEIAAKIALNRPQDRSTSRAIVYCLRKR